MKHAFVFGFLGPTCVSDMRRIWNETLRAKEMDAFFDFYRSKSLSDLEMRLSEMFLLERRGYVLDPAFQEVVVPLLDSLEAESLATNRVDVIVNREGILVGTYLGSILPSDEHFSFWGFTP